MPTGTFGLLPSKNPPDAFGSTYTESILDDGKFVCLGWSKIEQPDLPVANLYSMWVAPSHRGHGLGRRLVDAAIRWAKAQGMEQMDLDVTCGNTVAEALYRSMGFVPVGHPVPLRPGSTLLEQLMRRRL